MKINKILIASANDSKIQDFTELLKGVVPEFISAKSLNIPEPAETGKTFAENALLKATYYSNLTNLPSLADDSGFCIEALDGAPGVYSARFATRRNGVKDFPNAFKKIEKLLSKSNSLQSKAKFTCALCLHFPDTGDSHIFQGEISGNTHFPPMGAFFQGYDQIFAPDSPQNPQKLTMAQLGFSIKSEISHRAIAMQKLAAFLKK